MYFLRQMGLYCVREQMYQQLKGVVVYLWTLTAASHAAFCSKDRLK